MELPKAYSAKDSEQEIYKQWVDSGYFNPDALPNAKRRPPFSISMPPANATGMLHMGHAVMLALQDIIIRFERMRGKRTLWLPGTDHAAIATQNVVEKELKKEGERRYDLGREKFLMRVDEFVKKSQGTIRKQIEHMGTSCDWSRERFTLDEGLSDAVRTAFADLYKDGLIYRGDRVVNWCPKDQSTLADDEVEYVEKKTPFYYFKYGPVVVGTARPETKFGDKVIVVHPSDERYKKLVGTSFEVDWILGPITATVVADHVADPKLGSGAMTITPAHSFVDFDLAKKHRLEILPIIDEQGRMTEAAGPYKGMKVLEAREKVVEILTKKGLVEKIDEDYVHNLSVCYRCGTPVEPLVSKQWFVAVDAPAKKLGGKTLKQRALEVVKKDEITFIPDRFANVYRQWMENLHDWCISRQIWYGHRIPVWHCISCEEFRVNPTIKASWFMVRHGETDWNREGRIAGSSDVPLNEGGKKQAEDVAEKLSSQSIDLVISSPLLRAKETAEIIAKSSGAEIVFDAALKEKFYGATEGMLDSEATKKYGESFVYEGRGDGGESYKILEERIWKSFSRHRTDHKHKNVVIVTHGGVIRALNKKIRGLDVEQMFAHPSMKNTEVLHLDILAPCKKCGGDLYEQDPDTLDTWFSSSLWTFSTLGWPATTKDLKAFHPTSVMETGYDIIFFWVARMILMSTYLLDVIPFKTVYLHGLVRDKQGRKMSKSLGNGIDPLVMAEKYGADAVRLSLVIGTTPGNDQRLSEEKIASYRNYANKVWNIARFLTMQEGVTKPKKLSLADRWIKGRTSDVIRVMTEDLENFRFSQAAERIYDFAWHEFADWYLEMTKVEKNAALARETFGIILRLLHPFMPFVTERLWGTLEYDKNLLLVAAWPKPRKKEADEKDAKEFAALRSRITELRQRRKDAGITTGEWSVTVPKDDVAWKHQAIVERLARVKLTP